MEKKQVEDRRAFFKERIESEKEHLKSTVEEYVFNLDNLTDEECRGWMALITSRNINIFMYEKRIKQLDNPDEPMPSTRMTRWRDAYYKKYHNNTTKGE